jgi:hypothetical protein
MVWWKGLLFVEYATMLGGILVKNRVGIAGHELVWIDSDERRAADSSINGIRKESFTNTRVPGLCVYGRWLSGKGGKGHSPPRVLQHSTCGLCRVFAIRFPHVLYPAVKRKLKMSN